VKFVWSSDQTLLVRVPDALGLFRSLHASTLPGVTGLSPARESVMIRFDARLLDHPEIETWVRAATRNVGAGAAEGRLIEIPTLYIGEDLEEVAYLHRLSTRQLVDIHSGCEYLAWFLGFVPGFAYLGDVPPEIQTPRRSSARRSVPTGSVGIAGNQTGIYPRSTPGGWNLIGRTDVPMFDSSTGRSLIEAGDRVRFRPR
jgi:KipI family sensor histidine kinase inhibitor